ncbi:MAG: hypothetical protein H6622_17040 [Halobacteriovoraceae bacterium]|nr:hypothetical protein [Halobacteriovoraceae bacterium]
MRVASLLLCYSREGGEKLGGDFHPHIFPNLKIIPSFFKTSLEISVKFNFKEISGG